MSRERAHIAARDGSHGMTDTTLTTERHEFGAEVGRLLDLVVHALYSEREIFLRELVANAADAMDRRRFEALTNPAATLPAEAKIRIVPDKEARTLLIADEGIGMTHQELFDNLGTIARSGTRAFGETLAQAKPEDRPNLIGQFGVGFYSAFMVADRVEVTSRKVGADEAFTWSSDGGAFTIAPASRAAAGTEVLLHIKADAEEYLDPIRIGAIVRKWADHITVPITLVQDGKDQPANEGTAVWRKPKAEVSEQSYHEFYRHLGHFFDTPWATLHWKAEGMLEYFALLFIPGARPFDLFETTDRDAHVRLHVRRMFITDKAELLPGWLRFVQGVVDTEDLPLNVSREMLQSTPVLARIRKALVSRILGELKARAKDAADYAKFWENFGPLLKEGIWEDAEHRAEIAPLLRFHSAAQEGWTGLADYVARMKPGQEAIYYLIGDNVQGLKLSPQLEGFRARGFEVLLLPDAIDAFWPDRLDTFDGRKLRSVTLAVEDLGKEGDQPDISLLTAALKAALDKEVDDVRATGRLTDSAVVLAPSGKGPDLHMQRLMRRAGRATMPALPVLEVNPKHPLIAALVGRYQDKEAIAEVAVTLLDLAKVQEGDLPADPAGFARRVTSLLAGQLGTPGMPG
jgi:molecular chaperone HtpG